MLYINKASCFNVITVLYIELKMARSDTQVAIRVPPELHKQLKEKSLKEERSMNYLINKAIELFLKPESAKA